MDTVVITDIRYRMALAAIRSLGKRNIRIIGVEYDTTPIINSLGFYSKYMDAKFNISNASSNPKNFIHELIQISKQYNLSSKPVLLPVGMDSILAVAEHQSLLEKEYQLILPDKKKIEICNDTNQLLHIAQDIDILIPATTTLEDHEQIHSLAQRINYPVVIKYRAGELLKLKPEDRYCIVKDKEVFIRQYERMHKIQTYPIVQQYIQGDGYGVSIVMDESSNPMEVFCHQRLREYPASGGPSCLCMSVWNKDLVDQAVRLLKALEWKGVAMVEFKGNIQNGFYLMEINPRFWGSMPLSVLSGSDIPYALFQAAQGEKGKEYRGEGPSYHEGVFMRYMIQQVLAFPQYVKKQQDKRAFTIEYLKELCNPKIHHGMLSINDIKPSVLYIAGAAKKFLRKRQ